MNWFNSLISKEDKQEISKQSKCIHILEKIGSGSYGTVHKATFSNNHDTSDNKVFVAKRAWTLEELKKRPASTHREGDTPVLDEKTLQGRASRCKYYLDVEQHCLEKLTQADRKNEVRVPRLVGKFKDDSEGNEWLLFESITKSKADEQIALSLKTVMSLDWIEQHREDKGGEHQHHHLYLVGKELGLDEDATFEDVLDAVLIGLLKAIAGVHTLNVVHRDIKPENLLIDGEKKDFVVIDFGSAQDVDVLKTMIFQLNGEASVALSPIYAAPECFIDWDK
jgi:serine/threonine protein kinase